MALEYITHISCALAGLCSLAAMIMLIAFLVQDRKQNKERETERRGSRNPKE